MVGWTPRVLKQARVFLSHFYSITTVTKTDTDTFSRFLVLKGGPEPLEKEFHEFLGSKRDDRFSNAFSEMVPKTCQGSFFVPALA